MSLLWRVTIVFLIFGIGEAFAQGSPQTPEKFTVYSRMVGRDVTFKTDLDVPDGSGPFPAVILLHGCGGLYPSRAPMLWRRALREMGYATMIIESFTPRGWPERICTTEPQIGGQGQNDRLAEAFGAARLLRSLPSIKKDGVVLMGFSHGAGTVLFAAQRDDAYWSAAGRSNQIERFDALIAAYPWCGKEKHAFRTKLRPVQTPLLILIGDSDNYTPTEFCTAYAKFRGSISNDTVHLKVYPGALHSFDSGQPPQVATGCGGLTGGCNSKVSFGHSETAFQQAKKDVKAFLTERLP